MGTMTRTVSGSTGMFVLATCLPATALPDDGGWKQLDGQPGHAACMWGAGRAVSVMLSSDGRDQECEDRRINTMSGP